MKVVIDIPEEIFNRFGHEYGEENLISKCTNEAILEAFCNGTPLPKGHGDLITKEQAIDLVEFYQLNSQHFSFANLIEEIKDEKPIIEADKEERARDVSKMVR